MHAVWPLAPHANPCRVERSQTIIFICVSGSVLDGVVPRRMASAACKGDRGRRRRRSGSLPPISLCGLAASKRHACIAGWGGKGPRTSRSPSMLRPALRSQPRLPHRPPSPRRPPVLAGPGMGDPCIHWCVAHAAHRWEGSGQRRRHSADKGRHACCTTWHLRRPCPRAGSPATHPGCTRLFFVKVTLGAI